MGRDTSYNIQETPATKTYPAQNVISLRNFEVGELWDLSKETCPLGIYIRKLQCR